MVRIGIVFAVACSSPRSVTPAPTPSDAALIDVAIAPDAPPPQIDPDGNDDPEDPGTGQAPATGVFERVGAPPLALKRICDLTPIGNSLVMAHANSPLGSDGATIARYTPDVPKPFAVAFDWNRRGEPARGGAAGQGFLRARAIDGRLFVADADSPYNGLGVVERGTESYVFVSAVGGAFAPPRMPRHRVPAAIDLANPDSKGTGVLPRAYHVLDVIEFRGALFASTGSVPPTERAWRGPSPGALHRANADGSRWLYEIDYPHPYLDGVWRLTFMVRFRDRLYAGIQDYDAREPNDYVVFEPPANAERLERSHVRAVRVTTSGGANTLRWWADAQTRRLYWITWNRDGVVLRVTRDGDTWTEIPMPAGAGRPVDITRFRDAVVVLAEHGLWRLDGDAIVATPIAHADAKQFELTDLFCGAPLAVFRNELYAGGQRGGALWKLR
jgi:hypothetical protein